MVDDITNLYYSRLISTKSLDTYYKEILIVSDTVFNILLEKAQNESIFNASYSHFNDLSFSRNHSYDINGFIIFSKHWKIKKIHLSTTKYFDPNGKDREDLKKTINQLEKSGISVEHCIIPHNISPNIDLQEIIDEARQEREESSK